MGNQLAGIAPSQIYPVEHYLTELPDFTFEKNLGSTRFFKVARVKSKEGLAIVKVFAIHDPSLPLAPHKETLERIRRVLSDVPNTLPFQKVVDNPADFSYFFDTSRRRTCNIAPERFVKTLNPDSSHYLPEEGIGTGELTPAMDIFSLGCVLTELFTEGHPPFYFSQLLSYRSGEYSPAKILEKIDDVDLRASDMIQHMLQKDPTLRLSAEQYLDQQRDRVFPQYFYTFLGDYIKEFATLALSPDEKVARLRQDIHAILYSLVLSKGAQSSGTSVGCEGDHVPPSTLSPLPAGSDGLCIVVAVLTSCLRSLKHCSAKLQALELIRELCPRLSSDIILDRLLPYMLYLINDKYPRVRAAAVETLTTCLTPIDTLPRSDANVFPEYILPNLMHVTLDSAVIVRMALAENIALLAETALRALQTQRSLSSAKHSRLSLSLLKWDSSGSKCFTSSRPETIPLLYHPNLWIRQNTVGFVCAVTKTLSLADTQCKLRPMLQPYLKRSVVEMDKEAMKEHLTKIHKYKRSASESENVDAKLRGGEIDLDKLYMSNRCRSTDLLTLKIGDESSQALLHSRSYRKKGPPAESPQVTMNEDWQRMFGKIELREQSPPKQPQPPPPQQHSPAGDGDPNMELHISGAESAESAAPSANASPKQPQKNFTGITIDTATVHCLSCHAELQLLLNKKRTEFAREQTVREAIDDPSREERPLPPKWRPRGTLVAHMHEHKGAIHRLQVIPNTSLFATCSADGLVKIWDWGRMEKKAIANRSRQTYARMDGQVTCMTVCQSMQSLAVASDAGTIQVFRVEVNSNKTSPLKTRSLDPHEDGCVVDLQHFDTGLQSVLVYATVYGSIIGWDLRSPSTAWCFENNPRHVYFVRFHRTNVHGTFTGARVRRVSIDPLHQSCVWAAVEGNNEVSLWDLETQARLRTLWASTSPPLSEKQAPSSAPVHSVYSMYISPLECGPFMLTAGSDMRIRLWDINNPLASHVVAGSATDTLTPSFSYKSSLIDGTKVIQEVYSSRPRKDQPSSEQPKRYPEQPPTGHNDCISDIGIVQTSQTFIISTSKNGVVKVWK
ncbi:hypothetical protein HPB49_009161 [Dermacentor silvarum]|uniref:Uncharacterized protein n=1 Tax=Dermacentor silvarum TaxID=543639 RepID=A0ACB8D438_DERSI|nr:hypothetical protein HPB49_009161 [Dermacentor silvarum]